MLNMHSIFWKNQNCILFFDLLSLLIIIINQIRNHSSTAFIGTKMRELVSCSMCYISWRTAEYIASPSTVIVCIWFLHIKQIICALLANDFCTRKAFLSIYLAGAYLNTIKRKVKYLCPADIIPPYIDVDLSELDVGQKLLMRDLKVHPALRLLQSPDQPICNIIGSRARELKKSKWVFLSSSEGWGNYLEKMANHLLSRKF